ncbi:hypothetical protein ACOSQ4_009644 [Xanthoceras sorbifolium]
MENKDIINSMGNNSDSSLEFMDDSSSIGKEKVVSKGVHKTFHEYYTNDGKKRVKCKYCGVSYGFGSGARTTNMNTYMKKCNLGLTNFSAEECRRALTEMLILDELPFRRTIIRYLYKLYVDQKAQLKNYFSRSKEKVCLTIDTWTSVQNINYMFITCILSFSQIVDHSGDSIGRCIEKVLLEWGIDKVFTITVDNATANSTAMGYVRRKLNSWQVDGAILGGKYLHVRCCAHILNLIVSDGLKDLHESVVAIHNVVKYVKSSPSRLNRFKRCVAHETITSNGLVVLDVPTMWNSTFLILENDDGHYVRYFNENENGKKRICTPTFDDWENVKVFIRFLANFYDITLEFSTSLHVTSNIFVKSWCTILEQWTSLSTERDLFVSKMACEYETKV